VTQITEIPLQYKEKLTAEFSEDINLIAERGATHLPIAFATIIDSFDSTQMSFDAMKTKMAALLLIWFKAMVDAEQEVKSLTYTCKSI
jgi:hypothetical protein